MDEVLVFLRDNWKLILVGIGVLLEILFCVVNFIVALLRGRPIDNCLATALIKLPELINEAEASGLDGEKKYTYVYAKMVSLLSALSRLNDDKVINKYGLLIDESIENILSTPMKKKGESYAKDNEKKSR